MPVLTVFKPEASDLEQLLDQVNRLTNTSVHRGEVSKGHKFLMPVGSMGPRQYCVREFTGIGNQHIDVAGLEAMTMHKLYVALQAWVEGYKAAVRGRTVSRREELAP